MTYKISFLGLMVSTLLVTSCKLATVIEVISPNVVFIDTSTLQVDSLPMQQLWKEYLVEDSTKSVWHDLAINDGIVIYDEGSYDSEVHGLNLEDGKEVWQWSSSQPDYIKRLYSGNNQFQFNSSEYIYLVDPQSGNTLVKVRKPDCPSYQTILGYDNFMYSSSHQEDNINYLRMNNLGQFERIWRLQGDEFEERYPGNCVPWQHPNGDKILIIVEQTRSSGTGQVNVIGYNMSRHSLQFRIVDIDPSGHKPPPEAPIIQDNRLFVTTTKAIHGIDLVEGEQIWTKNYDEFHGLNASMIQDGIIVTPSQSGCRATDMEGDNLWVNTKVTGIDNFDIYNGVVYSLSYLGIQAVDLYSGKLLWQRSAAEYQWDRNANFTNIKIDQNTGRMVLSDRYSIICYQIPE